MSTPADKAKERTLSKYGEAMRSSLGFNRTPGTPAGMAPPSGSASWPKCIARRTGSATRRRPGR